MTGPTFSIRSARRTLVILGVTALAVTVAVALLRGTIYRLGREARMQRTNSAHYEILSPPGMLSPEELAKFSSEREKTFAELDGKLGGAAPGARIRIVLDPEFEPGRQGQQDKTDLYQVSGTTIRSKLTGASVALPDAADAEALLYAAWGPPGNPQIARWAGIALAGAWHGTEIGMAAAGLEQKSGHQKLENMISEGIEPAPSRDERDLLGGAWISSIAESGGASAVRKLYSTKMDKPTAAEAAKALGTTPQELDRRWQLYMFSYLAGMPDMSHDSSMPMNMQMGEGH